VPGNRHSYREKHHETTWFYDSPIYRNRSQIHDFVILKSKITVWPKACLPASGEASGEAGGRSANPFAAPRLLSMGTYL
jgi:hypothetical protein